MTRLAKVIMTLQEVKQFLKDNAEKDADVKAYLAELSRVSQETESNIVENYKRSQDFRSEIDRANTQAIKTYTEKTVPSLIEKSVKDKEVELENKYNPAKNPAEEALRKQVELLTKQQAESESEFIQESVKTLKQNFLSENGLPVSLADHIFVNTKDLTKKDIKDIEKLKSLILPAIEPITKVISEAKIAKANEMLSNSATRPGNSNSVTQTAQLTKEAYEALPHSERMKAQKEGRVNQILGRQ
jgi:hypothetical protein